jgi:hypothetical protein
MVFQASVGIRLFANGSRMTLIGSRPCSMRFSCSRRSRRSMRMPVSECAKFSNAWIAQREDELAGKTLLVVGRVSRPLDPPRV